MVHDEGYGKKEVQSRVISISDRNNFIDDTNEQFPQIQPQRNSITKYSGEEGWKKRKNSFPTAHMEVRILNL